MGFQPSFLLLHPPFLPEGFGIQAQYFALPISNALKAAGMTAQTVDFGKLPSGNYYLDTDVVVTGISAIGAMTSTTSAQPKTVTLRLQNFDITNYGEVPVYGKLYIKLIDGTTIESAEYDYTLRELVEAVAADIDAYSQTQIEALQNMLAGNEQATAQWAIDAIRNYNPQ